MEIKNMLKFDSNNRPTIEAFRRARLKTYVRHHRIILNDKEKRSPYFLNFLKGNIEHNLVPLFLIKKENVQKLLFARGGKTEVEVIANNKKYYETVRCSLQDIYCKKVGIEKCLWSIYKQMIKDNNI